MNMTHYMELLSLNQPWNLLVFMAVPVILAEIIAITELYILYNPQIGPKIKRLNQVCGITAGIYFIGIFVYLLINAVIPITAQGQWRGVADVIAVGFYLIGVIPLAGMALLDLGLLVKTKTPREKLKLHLTFVAIFLVVAHIAMIFGMLDPTLFYTGATQQPVSAHHGH